MPDRSLARLTDAGIPGIGKIPYGVHLCHFYHQRQDLVDSLVPYFQYGLRNGERCLWVTSTPLKSDEARTELAKAMPGFADLEGAGRIRFLEAEAWYGKTAAGVVARWLEEEQKALSEGFQGIRITGNTSFLEREHWPAFMDYEQEVNRSIGGRRIIALCSYALRQAKATDIFEVTRNHQHTVGRSGAQWEIVDRAYGPLSSSHP